MKRLQHKQLIIGLAILIIVSSLTLLLINLEWPIHLITTTIWGFLYLSFFLYIQRYYSFEANRVFLWVFIIGFVLKILLMSIPLDNDIEGISYTEQNLRNLLVNGVPDLIQQIGLLLLAFALRKAALTQGLSKQLGYIGTCIIVSLTVLFIMPLFIYIYLIEYENQFIVYQFLRLIVALSPILLILRFHLFFDKLD